MVQPRLKELLDSAKKCPVKGRMYMYESYKLKIQELGLPPLVYTEACRKLARYLEV